MTDVQSYNQTWANSASPNNSEEILRVFCLACACTLLIFGFGGLYLTFIGKGFQKQEGSKENGQKLDQDKGPLLVTWTSPVYLPSPFQRAHFHAVQTSEE